LGARTAAHPGPYNLGVSLSGLLAVLFAAGVYVAFQRSLGGKIGAAYIAVFGVGQFLDGLLREDCAPRTAACKALEQTQGPSWHQQAHDIETLVTMHSLIIAPLIFAVVFRRSAVWQPLWRYSLVTGIVDVGLVIAFVIASIQVRQPAAGLLERVLETV